MVKENMHDCWAACHLGYGAVSWRWYAQSSYIYYWYCTLDFIILHNVFKDVIWC